MKAGIIGASGYTGAELLRILAGHQEVEVTYITAHTYAGQVVTDLYPHLQRYSGMRFREYVEEEALSEADFHFVALPHGRSMEVVPSLLEGGAKVVDLSADYRLSDPVVYRRWYALEHTSPQLLEEAVYGLPEINRDRIERARLVANPGCYPTAVILALAPLAERGYTGLSRLIVDAKSGVSGAGRNLSLAAHFVQAEGSVKPYDISSHRHTPEIEEILSSLARREVGLTFAPHLVPMSRGILSTCYLSLNPDVSEDEDVSEDDIEAMYREYYQDSDFVVIMERGVFPETKAVCGSNYCHIGWRLDSRSLVLTLVSAIDNLVKGASGQAVQCMNIMQGWGEDEGLKAQGIFP